MTANRPLGIALLVAVGLISSGLQVALYSFGTFLYFDTKSIVSFDGLLAFSLIFVHLLCIVFTICEWYGQRWTWWINSVVSALVALFALSSAGHLFGLFEPNYMKGWHFYFETIDENTRYYNFVILAVALCFLAYFSKDNVRGFFRVSSDAVTRACIVAFVLFGLINSILFWSDSA